jgi:cytochrome c556
MADATELRTAATKLARAVADQDFVASRAALAGVANACNHCHKNFRVQARVNPFPDAEK